MKPVKKLAAATSSTTHRFLRPILALALLELTVPLFGAPGTPRGPATVGHGTLLSDTGTLLRGSRFALDVFDSLPAGLEAVVRDLPNRGVNTLHVYAEKHDGAVQLNGGQPGYNAAHLDTLAQWTEEEGLYLMITVGLTGDPGGFTVPFWNFYASRYADRDHVIYEIKNELVVRAPSSGAELDVAAASYGEIATNAPQRPVLLFSYAFFENGAAVLQDIQGLEARLQSGIDWNKTAVAFHGYSGATATAATIQAVTGAGYPVIETELAVLPTDELDFDLIDVYEGTRTSWISFKTRNHMDDEHWNDPIDQEGVVWAADFGTWPGTSSPPLQQVVAMTSPVNGLFVRVGAGDALRAEGSYADPPAQFTVVPAGSYVALYSEDRQRYVRRGGDDRLYADSATPFAFEWIDRADGRVALRATDNWRFVSADFNLSSPPPLVADRVRGGFGWEGFQLQPLLQLQITRSGAGTGTVTSDPGGIDCGLDCEELYNLGLTVTLTPDPAPGSVFTGWSGSPDCSDGQVQMNGSRACTATFEAPPPPGGGLDFNDYAIQGFGGPGQAGNPAVSVEDGGATLHIVGNGWRKISFPYTVTAETVLEFDFRSGSQGEVHGVGFEVDDTLSANRLFKVYGTQAWGIRDYDDYAASAPGWKHYVIAVGNYLAGSQLYLTFANDHDVSGADGESYYSNVRVYEPAPPVLDFNDYTIQGFGGPGQAGNPAVTIEDGGATLHIVGNGWRKISFPYTVTADTVIEFDFRSGSQGEVHGVGFEVDDTLSADRLFKVYGTQAWGIQDYDDYAASAPGWKHYVIAVGNHLAGSQLYLTFANDHDVSGADGESYYSNVQVHE